MGKMMVYHGSYTEIQKPEIIMKKKTKDFGAGFYCTVIKEQAQRWAKRYATPVINTYSLLLDEKLHILEFKEMSEEWLDFIVRCRNGIPHGYDVVIGAMANDQIFNFISDYIDGNITREQFWVMARFKYPTHQICFCNSKAISCLKFYSSEKVI